jgi:hypothetical protein
MSQINKESLEKLLQFISDICERDENEWFLKELQSNLSKFGPTYSNGSNSEQFDKIEKYLKLDGFKVIDYSEVQNERVRNQLFRDSIEMSKYRLGKFNDKVNFDEFCRYACRQTEELLNYFFCEKFNNNINDANIFITKHWQEYRPPNSKKIGAISMHAKSTGFLSEYGFKYTSLSRTLDFLRDFRNELSHRNSYELKNEDNILSSLALKKLDVSSSFIDYQSTTKRDQDLFYKGRFIYLKRRQDYSEIIDAVEILKEAVLTVLK